MTIKLENTLRNTVAQILLASILPIGSAHSMATDAAKDAAANFYRNYQLMRSKDGLTGIPNPSQLSQLAPLITPQLHDLLNAALNEQARCTKLFPENVPPWIEGDIFSSSFEGFTAFLTTPSRVQAGQRTVAIKFTYADAKDKVKWTDTLMLKKKAGRWLVDDIAYRANFAFSSGFGAHLQTSLKAIPAC
ncbi:MAG: hypothetical protein V4805_03635 [Pseudomonadota bacterium]